MSDRTGLGRSTLYAYMQDCPTGDSGRVQALRKRIDYLVAADKHREALESAETLVYAGLHPPQIAEGPYQCI